MPLDTPIALVAACSVGGGRPVASRMLGSVPPLGWLRSSSGAGSAGLVLLAACKLCLVKIRNLGISEKQGRAGQGRAGQGRTGPETGETPQAHLGHATSQVIYSSVITDTSYMYMCCTKYHVGGTVCPSFTPRHSATTHPSHHRRRRRRLTRHPHISQPRRPDRPT